MPGVWGGLCVCVFLDAQLCGNLCSVWVSGALVSLQARWVSSSLLAPPPPDAIRDCFHPPSSASGTLDFAPVAPTEAQSPLLSLGPSSSWPPPVAVRGVHVGCGASPRGAPPFATGSAWAQLPPSSDLRPVPRLSGPQCLHLWVGVVMLVPTLGWGYQGDGVELGSWL